MGKSPAARKRSVVRPARRTTSVRTGKNSSFDIFRARKIYALAFVVIFMLLGAIYLLFQGHAATTLPDPLYNASPAPWNQPIGTNPVLDPNSTTMVNAVDSRVNPTMNAFGMPLYTSTASDPSYTVKCVNSSGALAPGQCDSLFDNKQPIHIPNNAKAATGDDHWLFIYDTTKNLIFEMWEASKSGSTWTYQTGDVYSPTGDGVHQSDGSVQDGNGSSYFAGVVSAADWNRGYINHALSFASQATVANQGRYPMNAQTDGGSGSGHVVPMGARFFLDASVNCDGLGASKLEAMVCHAMQTYGGYIHDTGGVPLSIYFQEDGSTGGLWGGQGWNENMTFSKIPWSKMHVLKSWNSYTAAATSISSFVALPSSISYNGSSTLSWSSANASSCSISPIIGSVSASGSHSTGALVATTTYTLSCSGNGTVSRQTTITVASKGGTSPSPTPAPTSSPNPSPTGGNPAASTPSSTTPAASSPASSAQNSNYITPDSLNGDGGSGAPSGNTTATPLSSATVATALPACTAGRMFSHGVCACPGSNNTGVCSFARAANPIISIAAAATAGLLIFRITTSVLGISSSLSTDVTTIRSLRRRGRLALIGLGICVILYITFEFLLPGGVLNR